VIYSSAINVSNPEFSAAKQQGLPLIQRGQLLAEIMEDKRGIAVIGTHGKTTTTGIISALSTAADRDPTCVIGGLLRGSQSTVRAGSGPDLIAEADESDASFLFLRPHVVVVTNLEADHLETYQWDFNQLKQTFIDFLNRLPDDGLIFICIDDPILRALIPELKARVMTYGFSEDADIRAKNFRQKGLKTYFNLERFGDCLDTEMILNLPGAHNVLNALAAIAIAKEYNISDEVMAQALENFPGMGRRFHPCGEIPVKEGHALLFSDYGHHPTEVKATLSAARLAWPDRRIVMAFQPHRYSRTQALLADFAAVLSEADVLLLLDIYSAGESPIEGVNSQVLCEMIREKAHTCVNWVPSLDALPQALQDTIQPNDIILLQGAGNIESMVKKILTCHPAV